MTDPLYTVAVAPKLPAVTPQSTGGLLTTPATYSATMGTSSGYDPEKWTIDPKQTVAGQVNDVVAAGGLLQRQAEARSNLKMNSRGLLNSSLAIGAGQSALYDAALPIASADAQVNAQAANFNANAANAAKQFTASAANQQGLVNQEATNRASEFGASATNQLISQSNTIRAQANAADAEAANKLTAQDLDNQFKVAISNADAASKAQLQSMADATKISLASMEATYKQLISSNEQAGGLYGKVLQNITDIVNNPDISAPDKTTAIENQKTMLKTGMSVVSAVSDLDLGSILTFDGSSGSAAKTPTATTAVKTTSTTPGTSVQPSATTPSTTTVPATTSATTPSITPESYKTTDWTKYATPETMSNSSMFNSFATAVEASDSSYRALIAASDAALTARNTAIQRLNERNAELVSGRYTQAQADNDQTAKALTAAANAADAAYSAKAKALDSYWQTKYAPLQAKIAGIDAYLSGNVSDADRASVKAMLAAELNAKFKFSKPLTFS